MQWKSFVFILATAAPALAKSHAQHKHRHGVRHQHEERSVQGSVEQIGGFHDLEPITVTETVWECCTTSSFSFTPTTEPTTSTELPTETPEPEPTTTSTPVVEEPEPTSTPTPEPTPEPVPEPEPETSTSTSTSTAAPTSTVKPPSSSTAPDHSAWTNFPSSGEFTYEGFGGRTEQKITDNKFIYQGNVGVPWGSNIIEVSAEEAANYKYVVQFHGSKTEKWTVVVWNKIGPDFKMTGWYGNSAVSFSLEPEEIRYVAFDENSQGSWGAAPGDSLPVDEYGGYSCTWGEFDLGSEVNGGWSGWDVSAIQAEASNAHIQGMSMCSHEGDNCSIITTGAAKVIDAYMKKDKWVDGIGGKVVPGPVRIVTHLDYNG